MKGKENSKMLVSPQIMFSMYLFNIQNIIK